MAKKTVPPKKVSRSKKTAPRSHRAKSVAPVVARAETGGSAGTPTPPSAATPRRGLVIIHGAGDFPDDYHVPFVAAIEQELGKPCAFLAVYYADVTNPPHATALVAAPESDEQKQFEANFQHELQHSFDALPVASKPLGVTNIATATSGAFGSGGPLNILADVTKEVAQYLFTPGAKTQIQARLIAQLDQAAQQFDEIILASLSLGTVVAFDVLKQFAARYPTTYWFSCGCPLGKLRRVGMYDPTLGAIAPQTVAHWWNVYDTTDLIADVLGPVFPQPGYRIHDIFVDVAKDPIGSHDYFNNPETICMIADTLR